MGLGGSVDEDENNEKHSKLWAVCSLMFKCYGPIQYLSGMKERECEGGNKNCW